jgi:GAF domain-containing protein
MTTRDIRLSRVFVELADTLVDDFDVVELLGNLGERCVELFDAAAAGLLLTDERGVLRLIAATSEAAEMVELFQIQAAEGPCFDCFRTGEAVQVGDLSAAAERWPSFAPIATGAGFRSAHAFPLRLRGAVRGALNLFRTETGHLEPSAIAGAQAFADVATIAILQHRAAADAQGLVEQLHLALNSRIAIEQAKGVISEQGGLDMEASFARLRAYARRNQRLLSDVAQDVVDGKISNTDLG